MKTLQEKYNAIQEDNFSKAQFKRDAIMECGHLVTHFNSYDDIVNILINRGVIAEAKKEEPKYSTASPADHIAPDALDTGIKFECDKKYGTLDVSEEEYEKCKEAAIKNLTKDVLYYVKQDSVQLDEPGEKMEKVKLNENSHFEKRLAKMAADEKEKRAKSPSYAAASKLDVDIEDFIEKGQSYQEFKKRLDKLKEESSISSLEDVLAQAQAYADEKYPELDSEDIGDFIQLHGQEILDGDDLETSFDNFVDHNFETSYDEGAVNENIYMDLVNQLTQMGLEPDNAKLIAGLAKVSVNMGTIPAIMALLYKNRNNPIIKKGLQKINPELVDDDSLKEVDNSDYAMKVRAMKNKKPAPKVEPKAENPKLAALKKHRAEIMRDMEQEAEIEGGPIADRYGDMLNKIDAAIEKLSKQGKGDEYMSKSEIERRAAMIKEGDYEPRTKEDLVFQYLRDAWQFGAMKGKDVNPDEELSTMADSLLANLPDYDSHKPSAEPDVEDLYQHDQEKLDQLKRDQLRESFRTLIKNVIEG